ncbi:MAG: N-acetylneuraminate synthase family protein [Candidatus Aenigmatarchaeota archaeon]
MKKIKIGNKVIGEEGHCFVIAEAGVNHNNDVNRAKDLIKKAVEAGADAIKFQTYKAEKLTTKTAPRYWDPALDTDGGGTQYDTFKRIDSLSIAAYVELKKYADKLGIVFLSTPFDLDSVDILEQISVDVYKIASADIIDHLLIRKVAKTGKPIILSTGAATIKDIEDVIAVIKAEGNEKIIIQHCMLSYPCDDKDANLKKMVILQEKFSDIPVGYSDHTRGITIPIVAVALGAKTIEKHYTVDKSLPDSPDHGFAVDPNELKKLVDGVRKAEKSIGKFIDGHYFVEDAAYKFQRKSVVSLKKIKKGEVITVNMIANKRPGTGISPKEFDKVIGKKANVDIEEDHVITYDMIC